MKSQHPAKRKYPELNNLWIGLFVDIMGFYIIIPYLPELRLTFNTTPLVISALLATNAVFSLFSAPIWGRLSDKFGRKPMLLIAESGTCTAFLILAFSNSLPMLFIARIVDGIFGGNFPITKAIISDKVPPKDRGLQMTNFGVVFTFAGLVAPALAGFLSLFKIFGPKYPLALSGLVSAGFSFLTILITYFFIEESWPKSRREKTQKQFKFTIKFSKNKDAVYLLTQYALHSLSFMMYISTLTFFISIILGFDIVGISILLTISGISRAVVRFSLFKPTLRKLGEKRMTILGLFILVIAFFLTGIFGLVYPETWIFIVLMVFVSYGVSCSRGLLISKITQSVTPKEMGKINGYTTTFDSLAQIIGPLLGVFLLGLNPLFYGIATGTLAFGAFIMIFKKIVPLMQKEQFQQVERLE
ncbi:MAG: MFS transporter [Candidatus Lokiarchaeota archaeon]|nr:MFS transporter [Candidatus Lokiarchaeota archaeon]